MSTTVTGTGSRSRREPDAPAAVGPFAPMSFTKRDPKADAKIARTPLFEVDGVEYTVPAAVPTGHSLKLLLQTRGMNEAERALVLIDVLAGNEALNALLDADLSDSEWGRLIKNVSDHVFGGLEAPGN